MGGFWRRPPFGVRGKVKDIVPGSNYSWPENLTDVNGTLIFSAEDPEGRELWKMDP